MNMLFRTLMTGILVCVSSGNVSAAQCLIGPHIVGLTQVRTDDGIKAKAIMLDVLVVDVAVDANSWILPADLARIATGLAVFSSSRIPQLPDKFELTGKDLPSVLLNKECTTETRHIEIFRDDAITSYRGSKHLWTRNMSGDWRKFMPATAAAKSLAAADLDCRSYSWCSAYLAKGVAAAGADQDKPARVRGPVLTRVEPKQPSAEEIAARKKADASGPSKPAARSQSSQPSSSSSSSPPVRTILCFEGTVPPPGYRCGTNKGSDAPGKGISR